MNPILKISTLVLSVFVLSACTIFTSTPSDDATMEKPDTADGAAMETDTLEKDAMMAKDTMEKDSMMEDDTMMDGEQAEVDYTIDMSDFKFEPNVLKAAPGETITVKVVSVDGFHDLVIEELGVASTQLKSGNDDASEEVIEITVPEDVESGTEYEFYCSVGQHRANGMVGTFMVE